MNHRFYSWSLILTVAALIAAAPWVKPQTVRETSIRVKLLPPVQPGWSDRIATIKQPNYFYTLDVLGQDAADHIGGPTAGYTKRWSGDSCLQCHHR